MKALIAIPCLLLGGTEYQTLNLVKALKHSGYVVEVLCYFEHDARMVEYMRKVGAEVLLMSPDGTRPVGIWSTVKALFFGIQNALKTFSPDVVHVQYMAPGALSIIIFKLLGVKRLLATVHVPGHIYKRKWIPQLISKTMTDLFMTVSQSSEHSFFDVKPELYHQGLIKSGRKHCTVYNCVDIEDKSLHVKATECEYFTLGVVSRLSKEKGIDRLIAAMPFVLQELPNVKLLIVGDGREKIVLQEQAKALHVSHIITWVGLQPKESLESYYAQMDIVIVPSCFEGFGLTAIEAMSYAIPVVASRVDGLMEILDDQDSGLLVDASEPSALSSAILSLLQDDEKREQIGMNGYNKVKATFSYNIYQKTIADIYSELFQGGRI
jgi:glycosyltransferase involved in cell wall biosynthesis